MLMRPLETIVWLVSLAVALAFLAALAFAVVHSLF
jgi:hypothetical protein